jgi:hypothetical protein
LGTSSASTGSVTLWKPDLRLSIYTGSAYPSYQRVGDGTAGVFDYDATGFPVWCAAAATNAGLHSVGTVDMTATDAARMGAVVVKTSDAAAAIVSEFGTTSTNAGSMYLAAPGAGASPGFAFNSTGTIGSVATVVGYQSPAIAALVSSSDISADVSTLTANAAATTTNTANQGTGNYGAYRYYNFGRSLDSGPSLPFTGRMATWFAHLVDANSVSSAAFAALIAEDAASVGLIY